MATLKALFYTALFLGLALLSLFGGVVVYFVGVILGIITIAALFIVAIYTGIKKDVEDNRHDK